MRLKAGTTVEQLTKKKAYRGVVPDLKHCYAQGRKDRMAGKSFASCRYAHIAKVTAWESGWRSVKPGSDDE